MTRFYRVHRRPLSGCVDYLWSADGYMQPHPQEFVLSTASMALVIDLDVERADNALICGARSRPLLLSTSTPLRLIAAHFRTGAGFPLAGGPAGELSNAQVPLSLSSGLTRPLNCASASARRRRTSNGFWRSKRSSRDVSTRAARRIPRSSTRSDDWSVRLLLIRSVRSRLKSA